MAKDQGWHGDSKGHAKAAKGMKADDSSSSSTSSSSQGQGWHGDSTGHAKAAKGESETDTKSKGDWKNNLFGSD
jgi:hypothetical protein